MWQNQLVCETWAIEATSSHPAHLPALCPWLQFPGEDPGQAGGPCHPALPLLPALLPLSPAQSLCARVGSHPGWAMPQAHPKPMVTSPCTASPSHSLSCHLLPSSLWHLSAPRLSTYFHIILASAIGFLILVLFVCLFFVLVFFFFFCFFPPSPGCQAPPPPLPPPPAAAGDEAACVAPQPPLTPSFSPAVLRAPLPSLPCLFSPPCLSYSLLSATLGATRGLAHPISSPPSFPPVTATPTPVKSDVPLVQDAAGNSHTPSHQCLSPQPTLKARVQVLALFCGLPGQGQGHPAPLTAQHPPRQESLVSVPRSAHLSFCSALGRPEHHCQGSLEFVPSQQLARAPKWSCLPCPRTPVTRQSLSLLLLGFHQGPSTREG